jgi:hypothetical protein
VKQGKGTTGAILDRVVAQLRAEAPFWRLSRFQAGALLLLSMSPWMIDALFPEAAGLGLIPVIVFIPIAYLTGEWPIVVARWA